MDESKLLEECVGINLTPLETILLSKTLMINNMLIEFLQDYNCIQIERISNDNSIAPDSEQTGNILVQSALKAMQQVQKKVWESGSQEIGKEIPEEFQELLVVYTTMMQQIACQFIDSIQRR